MIEEPYRWVEAIANRREYVETQLAGGSPVVALSCREGVLFLTMGSARQKIFEIYDRIALGALGHPGDIERLRMAAIELASTEGFTRSAADVSLRRLAYYSLSPALKSAFEQIYGAPYLARMLFVEVGETPDADLYLHINFDGAIDGDRTEISETPRKFGALAGSDITTAAMIARLAKEDIAQRDLKSAMQIAVAAWQAGDDARAGAEKSDAENESSPNRVATVHIEAALLEREKATPIRFRPIANEEARAML